jgi:hypothetical protein
LTEPTKAEEKRAPAKPEPFSLGRLYDQKR